MNGLIVAVTGTPGTGKSTFAKELSNGIRGSALIELNDIVNKKGLYTKEDKFGTKIIELGKLNKALAVELKKQKGKCAIVVGHLASELRFRCNIAVVTRCGLLELSKRLEKRKYKKEKAAENLVAEALDYCGLKMRKRCKETYEVETKAEIDDVKEYIIALASGKQATRPRAKEINKMNDLMKLVKDGNRYSL